MKKVFTLLTLCALSLSLFAQSKKISGIVVDEGGEPVIGASVLVTGTTTGTISDYDGNFELTVPESAKTLTVSYMGMQTQEVAIKSNMRIVMHESTEVLQEVIAVAYGNAPKGSFAGSAQAVNAENIEKKNPSEISKALAGEVAGVQVINTSGQPGTNATIRIRGLGSINASSTPLYVVDGVPYDGDISAIDPGDIASTTILKDATATSLYGSRGANGVVLITTKKGTSGEEAKIDVDVKYGANMRLLPLYDVITSPEEYMVMGWTGLYNSNRANGGNEAGAVKYANNNIVGESGIPSYYNLWSLDGSSNPAKGNTLINPYAGDGSVNPSFNTELQRRAGYSDLESWEDAIFRIGQKAEATVKIRGGNEKTTYYTSFGYLKDEGYYQSSDYSRFSVRSNIEHEAKKWLKGKLNIAYAYSEMNNPTQDSSTSGGGVVMNNGFYYVNVVPPIYPVYLRNSDGTLATSPYHSGYAYDYATAVDGTSTERSFGLGINPAGALRLDKDQTKQHQVSTTGSLEFKLYKGLKFTVNVGAQYLGSRSSELTNKYYGDGAGMGYISTTQYNYLSVTANELLEYNNTFGEHSIRALAGHETNYYTVNYLYGAQKGIADNNVAELNNAIIMNGISGGSESQTLESYLATVSYGYDERYLITANYRADGSSKFAKGHRWGHFGSVGAAWNFTNESFLQDVDALKNGKLRLSWGVLGNQEIGSYLYSDHYSIINVNGTTGYLWGFRGTSDLTWERAQMVDVGLEFDISKYLTAEIDYFYKKTDNMIFSRYVATSQGYAGYYTNDAKMANQGVEFQFNVHAVDTRNVKLDIRLNGSHYKNEMLEMPVDKVLADGTEQRMVMSSGMSVGHSLYDWYLPHYAGIDDNGNALYDVYYDASKGEFDPTASDFQEATIATGANYISSLHEYQLKNPDADIRKTTVSGTDAVYATSLYATDKKGKIKSGIPDLSGGFGFDLEVYGVTLSASCSYGIGGWGYDNVYQTLMTPDQVGKTNWHVDMRDAWTEWGGGKYPKLDNNNDTYAAMSSDRFLTSNSYLSLNNVSLGYRFPKKLIEKIKLESLQLWVAGDNLCIASARHGYNPMVSADGSSSTHQYSPLSTIMGGIRLTF